MVGLGREGSGEMSIKEQVAQTLESLSEAELEQVARFLTTLQSQSQLYTQLGPNDRRLAEVGMAEHEKPLPTEEKIATVTQFKIVVEKHSDGYVAYPLDLKGVVVGEGDTYEEALADVKSAIQFHIETFGRRVLEVEPPILEAFVAEAEVAI